MKKILVILIALFMVTSICAIVYLMIERKKNYDVEMQMLKSEGEQTSKERDKLMEKWNSVSDKHVDAEFTDVKEKEGE